MSSIHLPPVWQAPIAFPPAIRAEGREAPAGDRLLKAAILFALLAFTVLDRFGLRLSSDYSIPPGMIAMYVLVAAITLAGAAALNGPGASAFLAVATVGALSYVVNASFEPRAYLSIGSYLLLVVLYAPLAVSMREGIVAPQLWGWTVRTYIALAVLLAAAGLVQFFAQFLSRPQWLFDYTPLIPEPIRGSGSWNTVNAAGAWIKSNGFFMREASIFSVAMAFALLCELSLSRRKWVLATLGLALALTYSGSGLVCFAAAMLFPLGRRSVAQALVCAGLAGTAFFLLGDVLNLSYTVSRIDEFTSQTSSAYCRFIYPGAAAIQQMDAHPWTSLIGHGPGSMQRMQGTCADGTQTTYAKALFEYGLVGTLAFGVLVLGAINRSAAPIRIRVALAVTWLLLGGHLLTSELLLFIYLLSAMWPQRAAAQVAGARPGP